MLTDCSSARPGIGPRVAPREGGPWHPFRKTSGRFVVVIGGKCGQCVVDWDAGVEAPLTGMQQMMLY